MERLIKELRGYAVVVITGGSAGIGKSMINIIYKVHPNAAICNLSRRIPAINFRNDFSGEFKHFTCDLSKKEELESVIPKVVKFLDEENKQGKILLINNSGFGGYGYFPVGGAGHDAEMVDVNVKAPVILTASLMDLLKARGGAIINVASTAAFQPTAYMSTYGATKSFMLDWSLALREELKESAVKVMALCPGPTSTEFSTRAGVRSGSVPNQFSQGSDEVAMTAFKALAKGKAFVVTGWKNKIAAGLVSKLPKVWGSWLGWWVMKRFLDKRVDMQGGEK